MDFSLTNGMDAVRSGAAAFDLGEETEFGEKLTDKLTAMYETAMGLYGESGKNLLADGGYTPAHYPYSAKDVRDTYTAIFARARLRSPCRGAHLPQRRERRALPCLRHRARRHGDHRRNAQRRDGRPYL